MIGAFGAHKFPITEALVALAPWRCGQGGALLDDAQAHTHAAWDVTIVRLQYIAQHSFRNAI